MKIESIFVIVDKSLLSVQFQGCVSDEFTLLFAKWQDVEFLENYFEQNKSKLQGGFYGDISVEEAVYRTIEDAEEMEDFIRKVAKIGKDDPFSTLQDLVFTQLSKSDYSIQLLKSKAYGKLKPSWLRLYAVRLAANIYIVSGGGIKLSKTMNTDPDLQLELKKMSTVKEYLKELGVFDESDYQYIEINNHDHE